MSKPIFIFEPHILAVPLRISTENKPHVIKKRAVDDLDASAARYNPGRRIKYITFTAYQSPFKNGDYFPTVV